MDSGFELDKASTSPKGSTTSVNQWYNTEYISVPPALYSYTLRSRFHPGAKLFAEVSSAVNQKDPVIKTVKTQTITSNFTLKICVSQKPRAKG